MQVLRLIRAMDDRPFKRNAGYADLAGIPDGWVGELIDGDLHATPRPRTLHLRAIGRLFKQLDDDDDDRPTGWLLLQEPQVRFGRHLLVPDIAGWRRRRMPRLPDVATVDVAPDWVCEGLSPSTARLDQGRKREIYARYGVAHLWFVHPDHHLVEVLVLDGASYRVAKAVGGNKRATLVPFTRRVDLAKLWRR